MLLECLFRSVENLICGHLSIGQVFLFLVSVSVHLGIFSHLFNLLLRKTRAGFDADGLLLAGCLIFCFYTQDTIGIDVEGYLDLRHTTRRGWNTIKIEATETFVVGRHGALTLHYVYLDRRLIVRGGRERLRARRGYCSVLLYQLRRNASHCLYPE